MGAFRDWLASFTPIQSTNKLQQKYELKHIPLDKITSNPYQPRSQIDEESLEELATSIDEYGVITPIQVTRIEGEKYQLIAGERRVRASRMLNKKEIPALIRDLDEEEIIEVSFLENLQREPMNPVDIANMYQRLRSEFKNLSLEELSKLIGKSPEEIRENEWILELSAIVQQAIAKNLIDTDTAGKIKNLSTEKQREFLTFVAQEDPSPEIMDEKINELQSRPETSQDTSSPTFEPAEESLESELGIPGELQERDS